MGSVPLDALEFFILNAHFGVSRVGELIEIMADYGLPTNAETLNVMHEAVEKATRSDGEEAANQIVSLLKIPPYRELLDKLFQGNTAAALRENVLDKDSWKFKVLADVDRILTLDLQDSWSSWGDEFVAYARQITEDLEDTTDGYDLQSAINELNSVPSMLDVELNDEIAKLEERLGKLPRNPDYDDGEEDSKSQESEGGADPYSQLDRIFGSLL